MGRMTPHEARREGAMAKMALAGKPELRLHDCGSLDVRGFGSELEGVNGIYDEVLFHQGVSRCWHKREGSEDFLIEKNKHGMWCVKTCTTGDSHKHILAWDGLARKHEGSEADTPDKVLGWKRRRFPFTQLRFSRIHMTGSNRASFRKALTG